MQIICVVNHKGGVAKTITAVNLAAAVREQKRRVFADEAACVALSHAPWRSVASCAASLARPVAKARASKAGVDAWTPLKARGCLVR